MPLSTACDGVVEPGKRVSPTGLITFDRSRCFVPASFANRPASPYICPERLVIVLEARLWRDVVERPVICTSASSGARRPGRVIHGRHHCLAPRRRPPGPNRWRRDGQRIEPMADNGGQWLTAADSGGQWRTVARSGASPGRGTTGARLSRCPTPSASCTIRCCASPVETASLTAMQTPPAGQRMVDILSPVLHHDEQAVPCAVEMAPKTGVPTRTHVLNLARTDGRAQTAGHRLPNGAPTNQPEVTPPAVLTRRNEPEASVAR